MREAEPPMPDSFFTQPIVNSPYEYPTRHWELDAEGQPTHQLIDRRRRAEFVTPIPKARTRKAPGAQDALEFGDRTGVATKAQGYDPTPIINELRGHVDRWRALPSPGDWQVTPETARLLRHWRHHRFGGVRPFFCQIEAVETLIWLTEVAPRRGRRERTFLDHLEAANAGANPGLSRLALKLATGAGKTTVMAMIIAWQTVNAVRRPGSRRFGRGFLVVAPGLTIRDRLRVLQPNDPDSYYRSRELVPADMLGDLGRARIVITNYHAFRRRETVALSKGGRALLEGRGLGPESGVRSVESEGQMLRRVMPELMGMKNVLVLNDEAHHCYREKTADEDADVGGDSGRVGVGGSGDSVGSGGNGGNGGAVAAGTTTGTSGEAGAGSGGSSRGSGRNGGGIADSGARSGRQGSEEGPLTGDDRKEAEKNREAARLWMSGLDAAARTLGVRRIVDLSATPFFLRGSGYAEGTLFPWTMSDFSLMDAIECGIVKLPRVPVADNIPDGEMPKFRNLWEHIRGKMPKRGRGKAKALDPLSLPVELQAALEALYGHYEKTFAQWQAAGIEVPPCFIVVCNNTSTSKLVYDYVSGFHRGTGTGGGSGNGDRTGDGDGDGHGGGNGDGTGHGGAAPALVQGRLALFRNFDEGGVPLPRPNTLLIDSEQLESGELLDPGFRRMAADEIERFRREIVERTGDRRQAERLSDQDLLREVMNTVGKAGRLGGSVRCVVSVSMLSEGWDASTVTHVLGVRAFGTQLLCEQVVGRALRRQSYDLDEGGRFNVEYADVLGIPFDFTAKPVVVPPQPPRKTVHVKAVTPERDACEIRFPRVEGYRVELPEERLSARFDDDATLELTPDLVGPSRTLNQGIIGEGVDLNLVHTRALRRSTLLFHLAKRLLETKWRDPGEAPKLHLFGQLKRITRQWLDGHLVCKGGTYPAQLMYQELADVACERITRGIVAKHEGERPVRAVLDPYNPAGSTVHVSFRTSKPLRWETAAGRSHVNWALCDSGWEAEFCRVAEGHPRVRAYVKNDNLGFEAPYRFGSEARRYRPDFIVVVDDGRGGEDPLHLVVEVKGYRREDAKEKKAAMETFWVPGVNRLGTFGRWAFAELRDVYGMEEDFGAEVEAAFNGMIEGVLA